MFDLQVLAWQADVTRVTTVMFAKEVSNAVFPASGIRDPFHNLSHHSNIPDNITKLAQLNQYHVKTFAYLVQKLKETPDGDGTLLDHSMVHVRQWHEQQQPARSRSAADRSGRRRRREAEGRPPYPDGAEDAALEPAARDAREARCARSVVRRQHRCGGDLR